MKYVNNEGEIERADRELVTRQARNHRRQILRCANVTQRNNTRLLKHHVFAVKIQQLCGASLAIFLAGCPEHGKGHDLNHFRGSSAELEMMTSAKLLFCSAKLEIMCPQGHEGSNALLKFPHPPYKMNSHTRPVWLGYHRQHGSLDESG